MTNVQLYLAIGIPMLFNAGLIGALMLYINAKFEGVNSKFEGVNSKFEGVNVRFEAINTKFEAINTKFEAINTRFDDMRDLWRAELRRVEGVLDARLKHLE